MRLLTLFWASSLLASTLQAQVTVDTSFASGGFHRMAEAQTTYKTVAHLPLPQGGSVSVNSFKLAGAPTVCPDNRQCLFTVRYAPGGGVSTVLLGLTSQVQSLVAASIDSVGRVVILSMVGANADKDFWVMRLIASAGLLDPQGSLKNLLREPMAKLLRARNP